MQQLNEYLPANVRAAIESGEWEAPPLEPQIACATCQDLHMVSYGAPFGHPNFGKLYPCPDCSGGQQLTERIWRNRLEGARLPEEYQRLTFATWGKLPRDYRKGKGLAFACAKLFVSDPEHKVSLAQAFQMAGRQLGTTDVIRKSLIFQGEPGLGKTGLAAAIINQLALEGKPVLYIRTHDFIESVKSAFDKSKNRADKKQIDSASETINIVKSSPRLVLDEFNVGITNDWRQEIIEDVIRHRYGNALPTILTCNAEQDELVRQWGLRTTHVLFTMAHWIPMGGMGLRDDRQLKAEEAF